MIDARAIIDPSAELHDTVTVEPFAVIGPDVKIGAGCEIGSHCIIKGPTEIGEDNRIFQFSSIGEDPQDKKYNGEATKLVIGNRNVIREYVTINRGTIQDRGVTTIGDDNLLMAYTHVAHDCLIANQVILANGTTLGGHVTVDDWAILGGFTLVHQFCHVGAHCFCAMGSAVAKGIPPYMVVDGNPAKQRGINAEGLKRRDFSVEQISNIKRAYKILYKSNLSLQEAQEKIASLNGDCPELAILTDFLLSTDRSIVR